MTSSVNLFSSQAFLEWYADARMAVRNSERTERFHPHVGTYLTRISGQSLEFLDYADYSVGDDPRLLSTRLYARTHRWFVKRMHHRSPIRSQIVLDVSRSMFYPEETKVANEQKWVRQCFLALALSRELLTSGDRCDIVFWKHPMTPVPVRSIRDWNHLIHIFEAVMPLEEPVFRASPIRPSAMTVLCGDFLYPDDLAVFHDTPVFAKTQKLGVVSFRHPTEESGDVPVPALIEDPENRKIARQVSKRDLIHYAAQMERQESLLKQTVSKRFPSSAVIKSTVIRDLAMALNYLLRWGEI